MNQSPPPSSQNIPPDLEPESDEDEEEVMKVETPATEPLEPTAREATKLIKISLTANPVTDVAVPC